jgi:hypothetical protein
MRVIRRTIYRAQCRTENRFRLGKKDVCAGAGKARQSDEEFNG